nr:hypothetical protein FICFSXYB_FICFSXYB_CDS_0005 [Microvirus sp.]
MVLDLIRYSRTAMAVPTLLKVCCTIVHTDLCQIGTEPQYVQRRERKSLIIR